MRKCLTPMILMLISIFYLPKNTLAQDSLTAYFNTEPSFTSAPLSPNAASAGLHAVVPRSLSVGLPSINVPVCMLSDVDISVPVTLQYHPDAVKPDEHPGWVGLGWNLKAGGSVVRITKGKHDEALGEYYDMHRVPTTGNPNPNYNPNSLLNDFNWNLIVNPISSPIDFLPNEEDFDDYEPDEFIFNFAGYSGKFYFNHEGEWVFTTNSGEHFEMTDLSEGSTLLNGGASSLNVTGDGFYSFSITTNDGTKYTFGGTSNSVEYTRSVEKDENGDDTYVIFPTAWHLTSIESINDNIVDFTYQRSGAIFRKSQNVTLYNEYDCDVLGSLACGPNEFLHGPLVSNCYYNLYDVYHIIYPSYLSEITGTDGNVIEFTIENSNQDNYGDIDIIGLDENTYSVYPKLTKITTKRDGNTEKEMELVYNDASGTANRLMLNEVYEIDDNNNRLPGYQFRYNSGDMPDYHSFEVDHWGYYNGEAFAVEGFDCLDEPVTNPEQYVSSTEMAPDEDFTKRGVLKGIIYPMGGYKQFAYEQNTSFEEVRKNYGDEQSYTGFNLANIANGKDVGGLRIKRIETYESSTPISGESPLMRKTYSYENSGVLDFTSYGIEKGYYYTNVNTGLIKYWNIHHNNVNTLRQMTNRHVCYSTVMETQVDGGYRVLNYSNFDQDLSGGTALLDEKPLEHTAELDSPISILELNLQTHTAPYSSRHRERGKLLQEDIYRADGTPLRSTSNTYTALNTETAYQVRSINRHYGSSDDLLPTARMAADFDNAHATAYYEYIYPVHLTAQEVTQYDESGANGRVTMRNFVYDYTNSDGDLTDDNNLCETSIVNSDEKTYKTTYKYTTDYDFGNNIPSGEAAQGIGLAQTNHLFLPVETLRYLGSDVIGGQITTYQPNGADLVPYQTYRLTFPDTDADGNLNMISGLVPSAIDASGTFTKNTNYELHTTYTQYSSTGIPKQSTQDGGTPNSIILSDDELLTMASVANAAYSDVAYTGFESYGDGNWSVSGNTTTSIFGTNAGSSPTALVNVSSGTYQISFWSNGGSGAANSTPIPVIHTATNGWAYHSAEINVGASVNFVGSGTIDELRLHPADALMTTSTYDPVTLQTLVSTDQNGKSVFYEYDDFERVIAVRDQDGNLVTDYDYTYRQTGGVANNSVRTHNHWIEGATPGAGSNNDHVQSTQYMDGLGRALQSIVTAKSPLENDIIQMREYDTDGREPNRYHPFTYSGGNGNFLANAAMMQQAFHANTPGVAQTSQAYQSTYFEPSPMSRSKVMRPEGSYSSTPMMVEYNVTGLPDVMDFQVDVNGNVASIVISQDFKTELNNTLQSDENDNITITYTDKLGRTILSRRENTDNTGNTIYHDTYTVFDNFGNVRYVVSPEAVKKLNDGFAWTGTTVQDLVYEYKYDRRQRMIYKKIPGADAEEYVYDYLDRVILMQDGNRNAAGEWLFTKYDVLGRVIMTGIYVTAANQQSLQSSATSFYTNGNDASNLYETPTATTEGYTLTTSYPALLLSLDDIHTINYFNDYDFNQDDTDDVTFVSDGDFPLLADSRLNNMLTGTRTNILGTSDMLTTAMWYDKYGRTIQVQADNHLDGTDVSYFDYEFATDVLLKSKRVHTATGQATRTIAQSYEYDHARRMTDVYHQIDNAPEIHLKNIQYNELGQVISNNLQGNGLGNYLQSVDYRYNERGWLTRINNTNVVNDPMCCTSVQLSVFLEGPYDQNTSEMTTKLNTSRSILPGQTPVSPLATPTLAGHPYSGTPWGHAGAEGSGFTDADYSSEVTDWVLISFRTDIDADTEIFKTAALLLKDGTVQFLDDFALPSGINSVYIVVEHLNHIAVMTPQPIAVVGGALTYDFTTAQNNINLLDVGQKEVETGIWAMHAGDGQFDNTSYDITGSDKTEWEIYNGKFDLYVKPDYNRDGDINGSDKVLWYDNNGKSSRVPRNVYPNATIDIDAGQGASTQVDLFGMQIYYKNVNPQLNSTPQYNGNISHVLWQVNNGAAEDTRAYRYNYDQIDRLTNAHYALRGNGDYTTDAERYSVQDITYDLNGNIQTLKRNGGTNVEIDNLTYAYDGNQLKSVSDIGTTAGFTNGASSTDEYGYDANGNLIRDDNKGIDNIIYNHLNLPQRICFDANCISYIEFLYDANGTKLQKTVSNGTSQDYLGGIEYTNGAIEAIYHEEGRATFNGTWQYEYYLKDHLGNTRVIFTDNNDDGTPEIIQEADYYPFGMRHDRSVTATNHYLYNGKELNTDLGLGWYDYGARWLDVETGRWSSIDPLAERYASMSPFNYVANNPISNIDPDGRRIEIIGRKNYRDAVYNYLIELAAFSTTGRDLLLHLINSDDILVISEAQNDNSFNRSYNFKGKQTAHVQFSLTLEHYGPENGLGSKGLTSSYHTQLAHELQHAKDYFQGNDFSYIFNPDKPYFESENGGVTSYGGNYIPGSELSAVETENRVREEMGMAGLRTHYSGINVFNKEISKTMRNFGKGIRGHYPVDSRNPPKWGSFAKNNKIITPILSFSNLGVKESYLPINSYESTIKRYGHDFRLRGTGVGINILQKK